MSCRAEETGILLVQYAIQLHKSLLQVSVLNDSANDTSPTLFATEYRVSWDIGIKADIVNDVDSLRP